MKLKVSDDFWKIRKDVIKPDRSRNVHEVFPDLDFHTTLGILLDVLKHVGLPISCPCFNSGKHEFHIVENGTGNVICDLQIRRNDDEKHPWLIKYGVNFWKVKSLHQSLPSILWGLFDESRRKR